MSATVTGGDVVAAMLEHCGVDAAFGVVSIHNLPILDGIARRNRVRFVPARGEAGAVNMADGFARASRGLGVAVTSTGTGAGNGAGALVEALTAGTPLLHLTGQIETEHLDRERAYIHETRDQLGMLKAVSKAAFRVLSVENLPGILRQAAAIALTAPCGPVSVEIPIDVQKAKTRLPADLSLVVPAPAAPDGEALTALVEMAGEAKRPMLWLGGGARHAAPAARRLADMGIAVVTSIHGRGTVPESHPLSLGAFVLQPELEPLYRTCDLMIVVGSRLRGGETRTFSLPLPDRRVIVDIDPSAQGRNYTAERFVCGDSAAVLTGLADGLEGRFAPDPRLATDVASVRAQAVERFRAALGPYAALSDSLRSALPMDSLWVRDITLSNSTWGNRLFTLEEPYLGIHPLGGGIGQGLALAIGAAIARPDRKTALLAGDGGFMLNLGELATLAQERLDLMILLMNDGGYGVIRNIQDAFYGGRRHYVDLTTPDFGLLGRSLGLDHARAGTLAEAETAIAGALGRRGPAMVEIDMARFGAFAEPFAGPPAKPEKASA